MDIFSMSTAVEMSGLTPRQIRYYEAQGFITPARSSGNHRRFTTNEIAILQEIAQLKGKGNSLKEIREILLGRSSPSNQVLEHYSDAKQYFKR